VWTYWDFLNGSRCTRACRGLASSQRLFPEVAGTLFVVARAAPEACRASEFAERRGSNARLATARRVGRAAQTAVTQLEASIGSSGAVEPCGQRHRGILSRRYAPSRAMAGTAAARARATKLSAVTDEVQSILPPASAISLTTTSANEPSNGF